LTENGGSMHLQNINYCTAVDMARLLRRLGYSENLICLGLIPTTQSIWSCCSNYHYVWVQTSVFVHV